LPVWTYASRVVAILVYLYAEHSAFCS